jgi:hypothetical protein
MLTLHLYARQEKLVKNTSNFKFLPSFDVKKGLLDTLKTSSQQSVKRECVSKSLILMISIQAYNKTVLEERFERLHLSGVFNKTAKEVFELTH